MNPDTPYSSLFPKGQPPGSRIPDYPALIGLTGLAGSGKTSVATAMSPIYRRVSFATILKQMIQTLLTYGHSDDVDLGYPDKDARPPVLCGKSVREAYQTLGTEWGRDLIGPDIWVRATEARVVDLMLRGEKVVVDDVRFDNEAEMIRNLGGLVVRVVRPCADLPKMNHPSEAGVSPSLVHTHLTNIGGMGDLIHATESELLQWRIKYSNHKH